LTDPSRLDLNRPRTLGPLLTDSLSVLWSQLRVFAVIGFVVVAPAELIVSGIGLGELTGGAKPDDSLAVTLIPLAVRQLVTGPLVTAMALYVLLDLAAARPPALRGVIQSGLDAFRPVFLPVLIAVALEALLALALVTPLVAAGAGAVVGLVLLLPLALAVRWFFVPQVVVVARERGPAALRASWALTRGSGWRVAGIVLIAAILLQAAGGVLVSPIVAIADSADSGALMVLSSIVAQTLIAPALAIVGTLLYFDLKARSGGAENRVS
jgi:hypothetical protein